MMDKAANRLFDSHSPNAYGTYGGFYGAASEGQIGARREREGICC